MKTFKAGSLVAMALMLSAFKFSLVKPASEADDAKAKQFIADPAKAIVYVFRDNAFLGGKLSSQFVVNNRVAAKTERNRFNVVEMPPGTYECASVSANEASVATAIIHNKKKAPLSLTVEAGKLYFLQEVFKPASGFTLKVVTQEEAAPTIKKGKLIAINSL